MYTMCTCSESRREIKILFEEKKVWGSFPERDPIFKDGVYMYKDELREDRLTKIAKFQDR